MYQGKQSLTQLAQEVERQAGAKVDHLVNTSRLRLTIEGTDLAIGGDTYQTANVTDHTHRQIGERTGIPARYYDRMRREAPEMLARNVNHWFQNEPEDRMVRVLDGHARAYLSNSYKRMDHFDMLQTLFPVLQDIEGLQIASCEVTDNRMFIKCLTPRVEGEVVKGDIVQAGFMAGNSEIGLGSYFIQPFLNRLVCDNGMVTPDYLGLGMKKRHVGKRWDVAAGYIQLSDEALAAGDHALMLETRDILQGILCPENFQHIINQLKLANEQKIENGAIKAVENLAKSFRLTEKETEGVLTSLLSDGNLSMYGMANAVTHTSKSADNYDRATELETIGGKIIDLKESEWREIAMVA